MELTITDEEYYDVIKSLRFALEQMPEIVGSRKDLLLRMTMFYKTSPEMCEFVVTAREIEAPDGNNA